MGFSQSDILMRQIESLGAWLGQQLGLAADVPGPIDEAECEAAGGLSLDIAAGLSPDAVVGLVGQDGARLVVLALGLARRAVRAEGPARATLAIQAHALWSAGVAQAPSLADRALERRLIGLMG